MVQNPCLVPGPSRTRAVEAYSNAGGKGCELAAPSGTPQIRIGISEWA
jgi:hypothetical protein